MEVIWFILMLLGLTGYMSSKTENPEVAARNAEYAQALAKKLAENNDEKNPEESTEKAVKEFEEEAEKNPEWQKDKEEFMNGVGKQIIDAVKEDPSKKTVLADNLNEIEKKANDAKLETVAKADIYKDLDLGVRTQGLSAYLQSATAKLSGKGSKAVTDSLKELDQHLAEKDTNKLFSLVADVKDKVENYQFMNNGNKDYSKESLGIYGALDWISEYEEKVNSYMVEHGQKAFFEDKPMKNFCEEKNAPDKVDSLSESMTEIDSEKFLMNFTNSKSPREALIRLGNLYESSSLIAPGSREFGALGVQGLSSLAKQYGVDKVDLNNEADVSKAVKTAAGKLNAFIENPENTSSIYSLVVKRTEKAQSAEHYSFTEVLDSRSMETYRSESNKFFHGKVQNAEKEFREFLFNTDFKAKEGSSPVAQTYYDSVQKLRRVWIDSDNSKEAFEKIDNVLEASKNYILARREEKNIRMGPDPLNKEANEQTLAKNVFGSSKKSFSTAVEIYSYVSKLKDNLSKEFKQDVFEKKDVSRNERTKVGMTAFSDMIMDEKKTQKELKNNTKEKEKIFE